MVIDEWLRGVIMYRRWKLRQWLPFAKRSRAQALSESVGAHAAAA